MHYDGAVRAVALAEAREQQPPVNPGAALVEENTLTDPTPEQIRAMRDAARRKRYPADRFGEVRYVSEHDIVREAGRAGA